MVNRAGRERVKRQDERSKPKFKYKARRPEDVRKRAEQSGRMFDSPFKSDVDTWRPKVGDNLIRIMPPTWEDADHFGYEIYIHRNVGSDNSSYLCPNKMKGERCPICEAHKELKDAGEVEDAKQLQLVKQVVVYVVDRDGDADTPLIYSMPWTVDRDIAVQSQDLRKGRTYQIDNPDEGYDVEIKRTGKELTTKYLVKLDRDKSQLHDDQDAQDKLLELIADRPIPDCLQFQSYDYLKKQLEGGSSERDRDLDDEDEEAPRRSKGGPKRRKGSDTDDDEKSSRTRSKRQQRGDDDDEDPPLEKAMKRRRPSDDDDDEDERETVRKGRGRLEKPSDDDDEDDNPLPDEDDDDEEEKPKTKQPAKSKPKRKPADDDDEDDDDETGEEDDDEDDEDERRPARKGGKASRRADDDDEDDDEDEEEEEEVSPKRKPASKTRRR